MASHRFKSMSSQFPGYESMSGIHDLYAANSQNMTDWVSHCKSLLMKMECTNIHTRSTHWSSIVNTQTHHTNHRLSITQSLAPYKYCCDPLRHLSFLSDWKGLKMRQITNYPRTYTEFEAKAKNWLNGRRAPNYGATLFPDMIKTAETYAHSLAEQVFGEEDELFEPYFSVLMYAYLAALCSERITMNNASKRTPLLLENSLKYCKTPTAKMLQTYAQDYPYPHQFPSHLRQAADFFHSKYDEYMHRIYNSKQNGMDSKLSITPNLRLNCALFSSFNSNNKLIINEIKMKQDTKMKQDISTTLTRASKGETASHSDSSSASAITPIAPQLYEIKQHKSSVSLCLPPPIQMTQMTQMAHAQANNMNNIHNIHKMVQLTSAQYSQLLSKIESLEHTQLQQRKVIACLAGKLQILEDRNTVHESNFVHSIPPIPPIPPMHSTPMMQSVPMSDINEHNVMPTINDHINGFDMDFAHFEAQF